MSKIYLAGLMSSNQGYSRFAQQQLMDTYQTQTEEIRRMEALAREFHTPVIAAEQNAPKRTWKSAVYCVRGKSPSPVSIMSFGMTARVAHFDDYRYYVEVDGIPGIAIAPKFMFWVPSENPYAQGI